MGHVGATLLIVIGLVALAVGAEVVVRSSSRVARRLGVSPMIIGLTIVSATTSVPELAVGIDAALIGAPDLAVANIAGTNAVNLLLILGLSALLRPIPLQARTVRPDLPMMACAAVAALLFAIDRTISQLDGALLLMIAIGYTAVIIRSSRRDRARVRAEYAAESPAPPRRAASRLILELVSLLAGIVIVVLGADWLVNGAVDFARRFGISDAVIGLTIVAIGTSAPELAMMIITTARNHRDVAIGNLIGSSVYNIAFILATTALVVPGGLHITTEVVRIDLPIMTAATLACVPVFIGDRRVTRLEGGLFVLSYAAYLSYLILVRT